MFVDFIKFVVKEVVVLVFVDKFVFFFVLLLMFVLGMVGWVVIFVIENWVFVDFNIGIFYIFVVFFLGVYGIIMGGWVFNLKYLFLGLLCFVV